MARVSFPTSRASGSSMRSIAPLPSCFSTSTIRPRVRTRSCVPCSSEVMRRPEMESSSFSPVSFTKSATATVGRPPGICRSQTRQVARPATARPIRMKAVANAAIRRRRRGRYPQASGAKLREPGLPVPRSRRRILGQRRAHHLRHRPGNTGEPRSGSRRRRLRRLPHEVGLRLRGPRPGFGEGRPLHRPLPGEHLPEHHSRRPDVGPLVDRPPPPAPAPCRRGSRPRWIPPCPVGEPVRSRATSHDRPRRRKRSRA